MSIVNRVEDVARRLSGGADPAAVRASQEAAARTAQQGADRTLDQADALGDDISRRLQEAAARQSESTPDLNTPEGVAEHLSRVQNGSQTSASQAFRQADEAGQAAVRAFSPQEQANEIALHLAKNGQGEEAAKIMRRSPNNALNYARKKNLGPVSARDELAELKERVAENLGQRELAQLNKSIRGLDPEKALKRLDGKKLSDGTSIRELRTEIRSEEISGLGTARQAAVQADALSPEQKFDQLSQRLSDSGHPRALDRYEAIKQQDGVEAALEKAKADGYSHLAPEQQYEEIIENLVEQGSARKVRKLSEIYKEEGAEAAVERSRGLDIGGRVTRGIDNMDQSLRQRIDNVGDSLREAAEHPFKTAMNLPGNIGNAILSGVQAFRNLGTKVGTIGVTGAGMAAVTYGAVTAGALTDQHLLDGAVSEAVAHGLEDETSLVGQIANDTIEVSAHLLELKTHLTGAIPNFGASVAENFMRAAEIYDDDYKYAEISDNFLHAGADYLAGNGMQAFMHLTGYGILPQDAMRAYTMAAEETNDPRELAEMSVRNLGVIIETRKETNPAYGTAEYGQNLIASITGNEHVVEGAFEGAEKVTDSVASGLGVASAAAAGGALSLGDHFSNAISSVMDTTEMANMMQNIFGSIMQFVAGALNGINEFFGFSSEGIQSNSGQDRIGMEPGSNPAPDPATSTPSPGQVANREDELNPGLAT